MVKLVETLKDLFLAIKKYPDRYNELAAMIKDTLNNSFENKIICEKVFICKGADDYKEPLTVIPIMPVSEILEIDTWVGWCSHSIGWHCCRCTLLQRQQKA